MNRCPDPVFSSVKHKHKPAAEPGQVGGEALGKEENKTKVSGGNHFMAQWSLEDGRKTGACILAPDVALPGTLGSLVPLVTVTASETS